MGSEMEMRRRPPLQKLLFGGGTPKTAFLTSLVVGSILTLINHGDTIFAGESPSLYKVFLTYCVPYCVTTWGAVTGKLSAAKPILGPE